MLLKCLQRSLMSVVFSLPSPAEDESYVTTRDPALKDTYNGLVNLQYIAFILFM